MYSFYLDNRHSKGFAYIDYSEEKAIETLYQKHNIPFIIDLWNRYYEDHIWGLEELENAQRNITDYDTNSKEERERMYLIYKLIAIVCYAIFHQKSLVGSGD